ncbi:MAG: helix-turn-helix domain-containing protein [Yaniella sp.]|nr:helix-turn-helix domain-containing protein [Yaniella sp.]
MSDTTTVTAMTKHDLPTLMTRDDAAELLGVSPRTLSNWNSAGRGPRPVKYGAQSVMYLPEAIQAWIASERAAS